MQSYFCYERFDFEKYFWCNKVLAKAESTNLNFTKKVRILFVKSEVEMDLRKRNRFFTKYLTGWKKTCVGIISGVVGFHKIWKYCGFRDIYFMEFHNISWFTYILWNPICEFRFPNTLIFFFYSDILFLCFIFYYERHIWILISLFFIIF